MSESPTPEQPQSPYRWLDEPELLPPFGGRRGRDVPEEVATPGARVRDAPAALPPAGRSGYEQILAARRAALARIGAAGVERQAPAVLPPHDIPVRRGPESRRRSARRLRPVLAFSGLLAVPAFAGLILAAVGLPQLPALSVRRSVSATAHVPASPSAASGAPVLPQSDGGARLLADVRSFEGRPRPSGPLLSAFDDGGYGRSSRASPVRGFPDTAHPAEVLTAGPAPDATGSGDEAPAPEPMPVLALLDRGPDLEPGQDVEANGNGVSALADEGAPAGAPEPPHPEVADSAPLLLVGDRSPDPTGAAELADAGPASARDSARLPGEPEGATAEPTASDPALGAEAAAGTFLVLPLRATSNASAAVPEQATAPDAVADRASAVLRVEEAFDERPPAVRIEAADAPASDATPAIAAPAPAAAPSGSVEAEELPLLETDPGDAPRLASDGATDRSGAAPDTDAAPVASVAVPRPAAPEPDSEPPVREGGAKRRDTALPPALVEALVARGDAMVARRDISAARLLYERAAAAGSVRAAAALARTHDPDFLAGIGAQGIRGDAALAGAWYRKAAALGDGEALARAEALRGSDRSLQGRP